MKILQKGFTKDGFSIQLEDWSEDFTTYKYKFDIGAYPKGNWNKRFRAQCEFEDKAEAVKAFEELLNGYVTVFDLAFTVMVSGGNRIPIKDTRLKHIDES